MGLSNVVSELENRATFGSTLVINDGNLRIQEGQLPERIVILGACSNSAADPVNTGEYLIPSNEPFAIVTTQDLKYFKNDDPEATPSEILLQYEDAYNAGGRNFEFVILTRTVAQLAGDVTDTGVILPVSTIYTNRVSAVANMGAHPTGNVGCAVFTHNEDIFFIGGERPNTPATGTLDCTAGAGFGAGEYIRFDHADGTVFAFWFDETGTATEPAAVTTLVAAGATAVEVNVNGLTDEQAADALCAAIEASDLPITAYDANGTGGIALESDEAGTAGNLWTATASGGATGISVTGAISGGAATHTISTRMMKYDPVTDEWSNVTNATGVPIRMVAARRDAGVARHSNTIVHIPGGMTTLRGAGTDTASTAVDTITFTGAGASTATVAAGTVLGARHGEGTWVQVSNGTCVVFGGNTANSAPTSRTDTVFTVTTTSTAAPMVDSTINMNAATRWAGGFYSAAEDYIYVAGGETAAGAIDETVVWDVAGADFTTAVTPSDLSEAKYDFACVSVADAGWVIGGTDGTDESRVIERFDPDSHTWQRKSTLGTAARGGRASVSNYHIFYADDIQGSDYNIGLGNLSDQYVGFPSTFPFYIQVEWEIMKVTGVTVTRSRGRDVDAFVVVRGQRGSTAIAHVDYADVVEDPVELYSQLDDAYEAMMNSSQADYVLPPARAVADCPYLPVGSNFAFQLGMYCHLKTKLDRACMGALGVFPASENPRIKPTLTEENTWVTKLIDYSRVNYQSSEFWDIGDGVTDANGDGKPDTYALWATTDATIPVGAPPMDAGNVELDDEDQPIDLGKYLFIVRAYGFATSDRYVAKFPSATLGYMRHGAAAYIGATVRLNANEGGTNMVSRGFTPHRFYSFQQENQMVLNRYLGIVNRGSNGFRWDTGYTFAWNVSRTHRSDYVLGSTFRRTVLVSRIMRDILGRYYGEAVIGPSRNALEVDITEAIKALVNAGAIGPETEYQLIVSNEDRILGTATLLINLQSVGELTHVRMVISQK